MAPRRGVPILTPLFAFKAHSSPQLLIDEIDAWLCSEPLRQLVRLFSSGRDLHFVPEPEFYESLVNFVDDHWNSRGVVTTERYATKYRAVPPHLHDAVKEAARELGIVDSLLPGAANYDAIIVPGTQLRSMVMRVGHLKELRRYGVTSDRYFGLGSHRDLTDEELADAAVFGLNGFDEYSLMCSIFSAVFESLNTVARMERASTLSPFVDSRTDFKSRRRHLAFSVLSASNANGKRPTTFDTLRAWAAEFPVTPEIKRVLFVTQPLYVYQQGAVAIEILGLENGLDVDVVGAPEREYLPGFSFPDWSVPRILQEVNGSVKRLVSLRASLMQHDSANEGVLP